MSNDITIIKTTLDKATDILVLLPQNPGPDSIASALALTISLENSGKKPVIACATPIDFSQYPLRQHDLITQKVGNKNLVISLKIDNRDSVDKVSYNLDEVEKVFNLVISPKKGANPINHEAVSFSLAGAKADLIITVGASSFNDLGSLYTAEPGIFTDVPTIALNRLEPIPFATHHLSQPESSTLAEYISQIVDALGLSLNADAATNLLAAIDVVTDKLQLASTEASTFEAVGKLIRAGGTRIILNSQNQSQNQPVPKDWLEPKILKASDSGETSIPVVQSS